MEVPDRTGSWARGHGLFMSRDWLIQFRLTNVHKCGLKHHHFHFPVTESPIAGFPQTGFQQTGFPQTGFPQTGFPQTGFLQTGFPQTGFPQTGFLRQGSHRQGFHRQGFQGKSGEHKNKIPGLEKSGNFLKSWTKKIR